MDDVDKGKNNVWDAREKKVLVVTVTKQIHNQKSFFIETKINDRNGIETKDKTIKDKYKNNQWGRTKESHIKTTRRRLKKLTFKLSN